MMLDKEFLPYAHRELTDFGELCAGDIDVRAKYTDRQGSLAFKGMMPMVKRYQRFGSMMAIRKRLKKHIIRVLLAMYTRIFHS